MGAWATGTNTGLAMSKIAMVKNTGPEIDKIVDTLRHFGPRFVYLISAYPPFLKHLRDRLDADGFAWDRYDLHGFVGGEALTEGLRDYLEERFTRVYSGYGASDLTIGMAGESDLSVWLRRTLAAHTERCARDVLGPDEQRASRWSSSTTRSRPTSRPRTTASCSSRSTRPPIMSPKAALQHRRRGDDR